MKLARVMLAFGVSLAISLLDNLNYVSQYKYLWTGKEERQFGFPVVSFGTLNWI